MVLGKLGLSHTMGGWLFVLVLLFASLLMGYLLYEWIEKPIAKLFQKRPAAAQQKPEHSEQPLRRSIWIRKGSILWLGGK